MGRKEAWEEAVRQFGDPEKIRGEVREIDKPWEGEMKRVEWFDSVKQDLGYALRQLRKSPGFAFVAILTLALGVGVSTAMFTVVNGVLFRPLPFFEPDRLVAVTITSAEEVSEASRVLNEHFLEMRRMSSPFAQVATYFNFPPVTLTGAGEPVRMNAAHVTAGFVDVLGVRPALGRGFTLSDERSSGSPVVVLGDVLWRSRFGADPDIVGRTTTLDGVSVTVVGVMPPTFDFPDRSDLWLPLAMEDDQFRIARPVVARLRENITKDRASAELSALAAAAGWRDRTGEEMVSTRVYALKDLVVGDSQGPLLIFTGAVALVLLISCTNVANLLLMRAGTREREIGLRRVLGAGKPRLVRQLLTESVMVAVLGGAVGVVVAAVGVQALLALAPPGTIPRGQEVRIDLAVLAFTLAVSTAIGIGFGLAPAFKATRRELRDIIAAGARTLSPRRGLAQSGLVVAEVGLAVVLLASAGLLLRSFQQIRAVDLGFRTENTLSFTIDLPEHSYADPELSRALHRRILDGLAEIPGVEAAGAANLEPFGTIRMVNGVTVEGTSAGPSPVAWTIASPGYFSAMGMPVLSGRGFAAQDRASTLSVVVLSRSAAEQLWPNANPVGKRLTRSLNPGPDDWLTVVGIVEDVVRRNVTETKEPVAYFALAQTDNRFLLGHMSYVVRSATSLRAVAAAMRSALRDADPNLPTGTISTMDEIVLSTMGDRIFQARVLGVFAVLALLLAGLGVYGVTAYSVSERTREIGIRMALGAHAGHVARMTLTRALTLVVPGLLLGVGGALATSRLIAASLYEVTPADPTTFIGVALLLGGVAIIAAIVPTRRATRVSPVDVLSG